MALQAKHVLFLTTLGYFHSEKSDLIFWGVKLERSTTEFSIIFLKVAVAVAGRVNKMTKKVLALLGDGGSLVIYLSQKSKKIFTIIKCSVPIPE